MKKNEKEWNLYFHCSAVFLLYVLSTVTEPAYIIHIVVTAEVKPFFFFFYYYSLYVPELTGILRIFKDTLGLDFLPGLTFHSYEPEGVFQLSDMYF